MVQSSDPSYPNDVGAIANNGIENHQQHHSCGGSHVLRKVTLPTVAHDECNADWADLGAVVVDEKSESFSRPGNADESWEVAITSPRHHCGCSLRRILYVAIPLLIAIAGIVVWMEAFSPNGVQNPFVGTDPPGATEAQKWNSNGRGVTLTVENALETRYDAYFDEYIEKWQASNALSLTVNRLDHQPDCEPSTGRLKVCNGNYGRTDWRGLATYLLHNGKMRFCIAQLNDFFLDAEGSVQQRYTMCHELGHGWGLPHTDENYWNQNRGDCMDYAQFPRGNLEPGQYNYDLLRELYGTVDGSTASGGLRRRAELLLRPPLEKGENIIPDSVMEKYKNAAQTVASTVGQTEYVELGDGYAIAFHKLLVV